MFVYDLKPIWLVAKWLQKHHLFFGERILKLKIENSFLVTTLHHSYLSQGPTQIHKLEFVVLAEAVLISGVQSPKD